MNPIRTNAALLKEVTFFDEDWGNNENKHIRFSKLRVKLVSKFSGSAHPGVFILRRNSGRSLEIARKLKEKYGFKIVDVTTQTVSEIINDCVGAKILIGIEGSHLMHAMMVMEEGMSVLTL